MGLWPIQHLIFPQALIQGALVRLGLPAVVTTESSGLPQCEHEHVDLIVRSLADCVM